jgi:hypothetical protein
VATREDMLKTIKKSNPDYVPPASAKEPAVGFYGWICPKCRAVMSPFQNYCIKCTNLSADFTWSAGTSVSLGGSVICHNAPTANYGGGKE